MVWLEKWVRHFFDNDIPESLSQHLLHRVGCSRSVDCYQACHIEAIGSSSAICVPFGENGPAELVESRRGREGSIRPEGLATNSCRSGL